MNRTHTPMQGEQDFDSQREQTSATAVTAASQPDKSGETSGDEGGDNPIDKA